MQEVLWLKLDLTCMPVSIMTKTTVLPPIVLLGLVITFVCV